MLNPIVEYIISNQWVEPKILEKATKTTSFIGLAAIAIISLNQATNCISKRLISRKLIVAAAFFTIISTFAWWVSHQASVPRYERI